MPISLQQSLQRAEATEQKLILRLNQAQLAAAVPGNTTTDPTEVQSLREALAAVQVQKAELSQAFLAQSSQAAGQAAQQPLGISPPGPSTNIASAQPAPAGTQVPDPALQAAEAQASQQAAELRQQMSADPEFAGGVMAGLLGHAKTRVGGVVDDPLSARTTEGKAVGAQPAKGKGAQKPSAEDPLALKSFTPVPEGPSAEMGTPPPEPAAPPAQEESLLGPITQKAIADGVGVRAQRDAEDAGKAEPSPISESPDLDALRELLGRNPDGVPTKPEGFTRAQRLAAGFLAAAAPGLHAALVNPEVARRENVAAQATALKARGEGKAQAGAIVLAQLETARQGRESQERIKAAEVAKNEFDRTVMSQAALLAMMPAADAMVQQAEAVLTELRGPGVDQGRRAYAASLEAQKKSIESLMQPFKENPGLLTAQVINFVNGRISEFGRNISSSVRAAATAAKIPAPVQKEYRASREIFVTAKQALKILNNGMGLFGTAPGGAVEASLFQKLQPADFKALDPLLSRITGIFTSEAGGKNLSLIESKLFGGQFTMVTDDPSVTYFKLVNALSVFGRKILTLEATHGGAANFGDFDSVVFKDPLPDKAFENLRDAGVRGIDAFGATQVQQPSGTFKPPATHTDTGFVLETE